MVRDDPRGGGLTAVTVQLLQLLGLELELNETRPLG
jgi:hypothetical protein